MIGAPNLIYQATHDFPQLAMAVALNDNNASDVRARVLPFQILLVGPPLVAVWIAGLVALLRRPAWRPIRAVAVAYLVALVLTFVGGGQVYYAFGLQAFLLAAGWVPTVDWIARGPGRRPLVAVAVALNAVLSGYLALPIVPVTSLGGALSAHIPTAGDQVGWPEYVRTVRGVVDALPVDQRTRAVIFTSNYGEAGAVARYGGLPPVFSGQNELYFLGPPQTDRTVVVAWTQEYGWLSRTFAQCEQKAVLDNAGSASTTRSRAAS